MHAILVTMGTDGDVFPYVGLGAKLRWRGHRVTLAGPETYQGLAARHGLGFRCLVSQAAADEFLARPDLWHPHVGRLGNLELASVCHGTDLDAPGNVADMAATATIGMFDSQTSAGKIAAYPGRKTACDAWTRKRKSREKKHQGWMNYIHRLTCRDLRLWHGLDGSGVLGMLPLAAYRHTRAPSLDAGLPG